MSAVLKVVGALAAVTYAAMWLFGARMYLRAHRGATWPA